jgi:hypothetical protein
LIDGGGGTGIAIPVMPWGFGEGGFSTGVLFPKRLVARPLPSLGFLCAGLRPARSRAAAPPPPPPSSSTAITSIPIIISHAYNKLGFVAYIPGA